MGILDTARNWLTGTSAGKAIVKGLDTFSSVVAHPVTAVTKGTEAAVEQWKAQTPTQRAVSVLISTGTAAAATVTAGAATGTLVEGSLGARVASGGASLLKTAASKVGTSFVGHPISTSAAVLVGGPLVAGVLVKKPELVTSLPQKSYAAGQALIDQIEKHPVATALIGGVTGGVAAYEGYKYLFPDTPTSSTSISSPTVIPPSPNVVTSPTTAETTPLSKVKSPSGTKTTKKRRKRKAKVIGETAKQIINIKDSRGNDKYYF